MLPSISKCTIAIIGLGYVGLPLAVEFAKEKNSSSNLGFLKRRVIGFDINKKRISELENNIDRTRETSTEDLTMSSSLEFSCDKNILNQADVFIITVPTPINSNNIPDLSAIKKASETVGIALSTRSKSTKAIVIYESTVYPGLTEEVCIPIINKASNLKLNKDYYCGYSPERINPGDQEHKLTSIIKLTSGSDNSSSNWIDQLYSTIISAGTYQVSSIKIAEAAKVIENTQRDLNIALVNELAIIFKKLNIDTLEVLKAAETKWNFLPFKPGLVGGHCIGVDPYYLTFKSEEIGYYPQVVLAGRRINDGMPKWIVEQLVLAMAKNCLNIGCSQILVLGLTFKENCPDLRNSKVFNLIESLKEYGMIPNVIDPIADLEEAKREYDIDISNKIDFSRKYTAVIAAVSHKSYCDLTKSNWESLLISGGIFVDLKGIIPRSLKPIRI